MRTIGFSGHRPQKLGGWDPDDLWNKKIISVLDGLIKALKYIYGDDLRLIAGGALGVDQWVMELAVANSVKLTAAIPFRSYHSKWPMPRQKHYLDLLKNVDKTYYVCAEDKDLAYGTMMMRRNQWILDMSEILIAVWDKQENGGTYDAIRRAREMKVPILVIDPLKIKTGEFENATEVISGDNDLTTAELKRLVLRNKKRG
jgi:uncharacterized phage-like protein YoqJ